MDKNLLALIMSNLSRKNKRKASQTNKDFSETSGLKQNSIYNSQAWEGNYETITFSGSQEELVSFFNKGLPIKKLLLKGTKDRDYKNINSLDGIEKLRHLEELSTRDIFNNLDLSPLSKLKNLKTLHLVRTFINGDLFPLSKLTNLTNLDLTSSMLNSLSPLSNLTNLTNLNISYSDIMDKKSIFALSNLTNLTTLDLLNTRITDISALSNLTNLRYLRK